MQIQVWNINGSSYHFGQHGMDQEKTSVHFSSDSLFAAMLATLADFEGSQAVEAWIQNFCKDPPAFALTSAFPRAGNVRFFPTPLCRSSSHTDAAKELKRVAYVSEGIFRQILQGTDIVVLYQKKNLLQDGLVLITPQEKELLPEHLRREESALWKTEQRPRVTIGRQRQNSTLYHTGQVTFARDCGLWFGIHWMRESAELQKQVADLFCKMGDSGLGGERSSGLGKAEFKKAVTIELPDSANMAWVSLSRYAPRQDEMAAIVYPSAAYTIQRVGGWLNSAMAKAQRRKQIHLLKEGSVFGPLNRPIPGRLVDVRPAYEKEVYPHPVYRCGLAVAVGMFIPAEKEG